MSTMGLFFRKTKRLGNTTINLTKSGASASRKLGPIRVNTRGRGSIRLGKGLTWRFKL